MGTAHRCEMKRARNILAFAYFASFASPAFAEGGVRVSEPSALAVFALGVLGVIVGRQVSRRRDN